MGYRTILAELANDRSATLNLEAAQPLAARFDAAIVGLHVVPPPFVPTAWEGGASVYLSPELMAAQAKAAQAVRDRTREVFGRLCGANPGAEWRETEGDAVQVLVEAAHTVDLVVTAHGEAAAGMAEPLVAGAGVPVLVVPSAPVAAPGRRVLVGWNGSREAARAVHQALPFLANAEHVALCAIGTEAEGSLKAAAAMLARHGAKVETKAVSGADANAGRVLCDQVAAQGADLMVVGAYGRSRVREFIFGGVTRHLLDHAGLPVLFGT